MCPECQKGDQAKQLSCDHVKKDEHWLSNAKLDRLKALYASDTGTALQELGGMVVSSYTPCFAAEDIRRCFDQMPRLLTQSPPGIIYIGADPSGGGPSHLAICSGYFSPAWHFVVRTQNYTNPLPGALCKGVCVFLVTPRPHIFGAKRQRCGGVIFQNKKLLVFCLLYYFRINKKRTRFARAFFVYAWLPA